MAEKHEQLVSKYRARLIRKKYKIEKKSPFVDYRPDIYASQKASVIVVEVEIESTLDSGHTLDQLGTMHKYVRKNKQFCGVLVVPKSARKRADFLIEAVFGDDKIKVEGI
jgi:hypothetical protein